MNDEVFEVLEPVEGEAYFSWILRMLELNNSMGSWSNHNRHSKIGKMLFCDEFILPGVFLPDFAETVVEKCNLPNSKYLSSFSSVIEKMTTIPFYMEILYENTETFDSCVQYKDFLNKFNVNITENLGDKEGAKVWFCPECIKEMGGPIFYREHQIKGNVVCWKHECKLMYINYDKGRHYFLRNIFDLTILKLGNSIGINENMLDTAKGLAKVIHEIFNEGLNEGLNDIYNKIAQKFFYDNRKTFDAQYSFDEYYKHHFDKLETNLLNSFDLKIKCRNLYKNLFYKKKDENIFLNEPVILALFIYKAFGSLENLHSYELMDNRVIPKKIIKSYKQIFYRDSLEPSIFNDFDFLGTYNNSLLIRNKMTNQIQKVTPRELKKSFRVSYNETQIEPAGEGSQILPVEYINVKKFMKKNELTESQMEFYFNNNLINCLTIDSGEKLVGNIFLQKWQTPEMYKIYQEYKKHRLLPSRIRPTEKNFFSTININYNLNYHSCTYRNFMRCIEKEGKCGSLCEYVEEDTNLPFLNRYHELEKNALDAGKKPPSMNERFKIISKETGKTVKTVHRKVEIARSSLNKNAKINDFKISDNPHLQFEKFIPVYKIYINTENNFRKIKDKFTQKEVLNEVVLKTGYSKTTIKNIINGVRKYLEWEAEHNK